MAEAGTLSIQTPKKRKDRFTDSELQVLVDTIIKHMEQLYGREAANAAGKATIWDEVVKKVNEKSQVLRTLPECRKRWFDYKRKVKKTIEQAKLQVTLTANMSMEEMLTGRQKSVAQFFKWDIEDPNSTQLPNDAFQDKDDNLDSEDDFIFTQEASPSDCRIVDSSENMCVPHSSADGSRQPSNYQNTKTLRDNTHLSAKHQAKALKEIIEPTSTQLPQQQVPAWDTKLDQLITQQQQTNEMLQILRENVSESLKLQKKMNQMLKTHFLELQKSVMSNQETSSEQGRALEHTMKSLQTKMNEINNQLRVKKLQELMTSDESDVDVGTPGTLSGPLHIKAATAQKRKLDKTSLPSASLKKKKKEKK